MDICSWDGFFNRNMTVNGDDYQFIDFSDKRSLSIRFHQVAPLTPCSSLSIFQRSIASLNTGALMGTGPFSVIPAKTGDLNQRVPAASPGVNAARQSQSRIFTPSL
jgi:hypothetical protein